MTRAAPCSEAAPEFPQVQPKWCTKNSAGRRRTTTPNKPASASKANPGGAPTPQPSETKMPDGSNFTQSSNASTSPASEHSLDPVTLGYVTGEEWAAFKRSAAFKRRWRGTKKKPVGPADFAMLSARAILHTWLGTPDSRPIYRNSVRYWWLLVHFEKDWIEQRRPMPLLPHERAALALNKRGHDLHKAKAAFFEISRFTLVLAKECGSQHIIDRFKAFPRKERRKLLLEARSKSTTALRRFFAAVERYKALRSAFEKAEQAKASGLNDLAQPISVDMLWRERRKAWKKVCEVDGPADAEERRVRRLHPPCPVVMEIGRTPEGAPVEVAADRSNIEDCRKKGELSPDDAAEMSAKLSQWKASCDAINAQHMDWALIRARDAANARWMGLDQLLITAPAKTLSDVLVKLRIAAESGDGDVRRLVKDVSRLINRPAA